jgi:hypothetical protein
MCSYTWIGNNVGNTTTFGKHRIPGLRREQDEETSTSLCSSLFGYNSRMYYSYFKKLILNIYILKF